MSDEQNKNDPENTPWVMPEPSFRSTEGFTPKSALVRDARDEPSEHETEDALSGEADLPKNMVVSESGEPDTTSSKPKKRGGCASAMLSVLGVIVAITLVILIAVMYFLFWYRPQDTTTF